MNHNRDQHGMTLPLLLTSFVFLAAGTVNAESLRLSVPTANDLVPEALSPAAESLTLANTNREPVSFAWAVRRDQALELAPTSHMASSKQFTLAITGADLQAGIAFVTDGAAAIVRLNPVDIDSRHALEPARLEIVDAAGRAHRGTEAMSSLAGSEAMRASGAPFARDTIAFRLVPALGAGRFTLRSSQRLAARARYAVHVFDRNSGVSLDLNADRSAYFSAESPAASLRLRDATGRAFEISELAGVMVAPDGSRSDLQFTKSRDGHRLNGEPGASNSVHGLWELQVSMTTSNGLRRDVRTAFASTTPTARFTGKAQRDADAHTLRLGVEAVSSGRYEARGVLYATAKDGSQHPLQVAATAAWLDAGAGALTLRFDTDIIARSGLGAPFAVRDLRLSDQSRMGLLHRQAEAFTFAAD